MSVGADDTDTQWMIDNLYNGMQQNPEVNTNIICVISYKITG